MNAKEKSRAYFNAHRKSRLARGGYWRLDYRHVLAEIETLRPERLIETGEIHKIVQFVCFKKRRQIGDLFFQSGDHVSLTLLRSLLFKFLHFCKRFRILFPKRFLQNGLPHIMKNNLSSR